jgi:hypothetical protein
VSAGRGEEERPLLCGPSEEDPQALYGNAEVQRRLLPDAVYRAHDAMRGASAAIRDGVGTVDGLIDAGRGAASQGVHGLADRADGVWGTVAEFGADRVDDGLAFGSGLLKGATSMAGGVLGMIANPIDTAGGLLALAEHTDLGLPFNPIKAAHAGWDVATGQAEPCDALDRVVNPARGAREDAAFRRAAGDELARPYREAIDRGDPWEAAGRGVFDVASVMVGGGPGAKVASKADDVARVAGRADDVARAGAGTADDAARAARYDPRKAQRSALDKDRRTSREAMLEDRAEQAQSLPSTLEGHEDLARMDDVNGPGARDHLADHGTLPEDVSIQNHHPERVADAPETAARGGRGLDGPAHLRGAHKGRTDRPTEPGAPIEPPEGGFVVRSTDRSTRGRDTGQMTADELDAELYRLGEFDEQER